jgi:hypothetical protein
LAQISRRQRNIYDLLDSACTEDLKLRRKEEKREREQEKAAIYIYNNTATHVRVPGLTPEGNTRAGRSGDDEGSSHITSEPDRQANPCQGLKSILIIEVTEASMYEEV